MIPEGLDESEHFLEEKAKAAVLLVRLDPEDVTIPEEREDWDVDGIFAYSKICTHVGCPVALYEQQTHHLLCPCHQSTFDMTEHCKVIFGPAKRPLPQLPITVDDEGYLVATQPIPRAVGPELLRAWVKRLMATDRVEKAAGGHRRLPGRAARPVARRSSAARARSSPTTGRSCWARSPSTASSSCCCPARS